MKTKETLKIISECSSTPLEVRVMLGLINAHFGSNEIEFLTNALNAAQRLEQRVCGGFDGFEGLQ